MTNWQKTVTKFARRHNLTHTPGVNVLDLVSEVGEVAKTLLEASQYTAPEPQAIDPATHQALALELGDVLYSLCQLANSLEINLDERLDAVLHKYEKRLQRQGTPGNSSAINRDKQTGESR